MRVVQIRPDLGVIVSCCKRVSLRCIGTICKYPVLLLVVLFLLPVQVLAQPAFESPLIVLPWMEAGAVIGQPIRFEHISLEDGLSQSSIYCILQDSRGFLWFGTEDGLNKYDGYGFTVYRHDPDDPNSLSHNVIWTLYEDSEGVLWVGTSGGGLNRFDRDTGQFVHYEAASDPSGLSSDYVRVIYEDRDGALWIGTNGGGLNRFDRAKGQFEHYRHDPKDPKTLRSDFVQAIHQDQEGLLWIGTDGGGLSRLDRVTSEFVHYQNRPGDPYSLSSDAVLTIYEDRDGTLWIGTDGGGLDRFDPATGRFLSFQHDPADPHSLSDNSVSAIYRDSDGMLWIGTYGGGLDLLDGGSVSESSQGRFAHYRSELGDRHSLSSDFLWSIYEDRMGVLWIGTRGGGLNKFNRLAQPFVHYQARSNDEDSLSSNLVWAIYEDGDGLLWVGTNGGGLDRFDRSTGQVTHFRQDPSEPDSLANDVVRVIYEDRDGRFWLGMDDGKVDRFDPSTGSLVHHQLDVRNPVLTIHRDREGNLWVGTSGGGLYWFDGMANRFVYYRDRFCSRACLSGEYVRAIYEDRSGVLWIATLGGGLDRFEPAKKRFTYYLQDPADPNSLSSMTVLSIHQDRAGILWIGTHGGGLNRFDPEVATFAHYLEQDGLANDVVYGILEDSLGYLWLSTNRGLSRFDPRTETFKNYDVSDGLQSNEFNGGAYYQSESGELFFGGINGFNAFFPEQVRENPQPPPIVITAFNKFNETVRTDLLNGEQIRLSYQDNFVSFEFAALDYAAPEQNQYAYTMENLERDWVYAGTRRHVDYPDLKPGSYVFRVRGSNSDGVWNQEGAAVYLTITPPFWETWWFRGAILLLAVGLAFGAHRLRVQSIETRSRELAMLVEKRTADLWRESEQRLQAEEALRQSEVQRSVFEAVAAERSRLARDLHDAVSQTLFSAGLIAEALPKSWERDREEGRQLLKELRQLTQGALAEMRTLLLELRPAALVEADLGDLMRQLAEVAAAREGLTVDVTVEGQAVLPADVHIALYRIAQEALNNVVKHARACQVTVALRFVPGPSHPGQAGGPLIALNRTDGTRVELCVGDDGRGFDRQSVAPDRLGLGIMRERAESVGARLEVESQVGGGTTVRVVWQDSGER